MTALRLPLRRKSRRTLPRTLAAGIGAGRMALGAVALARPSAVTRPLAIDPSSAAEMAWAVRLFAARDLALGAGGLHAAVTRRPLVPWLAAQAFSDAADTVVFAVAVARGTVARPAGLAVTALAAGGVVGAAVAARHDR